MSDKLNSLGNNAIRQVIDGALSIGKAAMHCWLPDDIEFYLCSLELVNYKGKRQGFMSFAVMPEQIVENHSPIQTMIKTHKGVVTTFNDSFSPVDIQIAGTFGRRFRILINNAIDPMHEGLVGGGTKVKTMAFGLWGDNSMAVKSGYGMTKVLEHILEAANMTDNENGKPMYLKFCNYSLNTAYVVDVINFSFQQSLANNCMWNYTMTLRAVAPIDNNGFKNKWKELFPQVAANAIAGGLTNILAGMTAMIS